MAVITILKLTIPGRKFLLFFLLINILMLNLKRIMLNVVSRFFRRRSYNTRQVIIVGTGSESEDLVAVIRKNPGWGVQILGFITDADCAPMINSHVGITFKGLPILGSIKDFDKIVSKTVVDIVFFAASPWHIEKLRPYIVQCIYQGIAARVSGGFFDKMSFVRTSIDELDAMSMISFTTINRNLYQVLFKDVFDKAVVLLGFVFLTPIFIVIASVIKLGSKGPVFFKQQRVGINGRIFNMYKFRSMVVDAESKKIELEKYNEMSGPVFKMTNDPRITKVGRFLRKTSLDELPQLINVLKGDMSLVGPRPPLPSEVDSYDNWQKRRLSVKPGITCTWQVSGRSNIDFDTWMKMDLHYIDNWSLISDAKLLLKTMPAVLFQRGAR